MAERRRVEAEVERRLEGWWVCERCGATVKSYAEVCSADLDDQCPGFRAIEHAIAEVALGELVEQPMAEPRWVAEVTYQNFQEGRLLFDDFAELGDWIERGPDWRTVRTLVVRPNPARARAEVDKEGRDGLRRSRISSRR